MTSKQPPPPPPTTTTTCTCPTSLHSLNETSTRSYSQCPVCLTKFDGGTHTPVALRCSHTICIACASLLIPGVNTTSGLDGTLAVVNYPLLQFLDYPVEVQKQHLDGGVDTNDEGDDGDDDEGSECVVMRQMCGVAGLIRSQTVSRSVHRKTIVLINSLTPKDPCKLLKPIKSLAERCLVELTSSCAHVSHYHAQQQLWAAIRARACQFMGPAMQDEALKLVLLALEDGSALSRKVLVMFVVQRLAPQFPQASKTSVGHIVQLLYRASAFDVLKRPGNSSLMTLRPEFRNYEALRREHDTQIMKIGLEAGIRFTPEQWSSLLYGDTSQKPLMQSIIDKLQSPQTFQELLKEYLVSVQRLSTADSQFLISLHPHFKVLSMIDTTDPTSPVPQLLEALHAVLLGLITFTANRKHQRTSQQQPTSGRSYSSNKSNNVVVSHHHHHHHQPLNHHHHQNDMVVVGLMSNNNNNNNNNNLVNMVQANLCI